MKILGYGLGVGNIIFAFWPENTIYPHWAHLIIGVGCIILTYYRRD